VNAARGPPGARIEKTPIAINSPQRSGVWVGWDGGMRFSLHTRPLACGVGYRRTPPHETLEGVSKDLEKGFAGGAAQVRSSLAW